MRSIYGKKYAQKKNKNKIRIIRWWINIIKYE